MESLITPRTRVILALTLLLFPVCAPSQSSPCPLLSSTGTPLVTVDVVVTDAGNRPIKGLLQSDFYVSENGKPQQVTCFGAHDEAIRYSSRQSPLPQNTFTNSRSASSGPINVILLDQVNTQIEDQEFARVELMKFFRNKPTGTRFAIFTVLDGTIAGNTACVSCENLRLIQGITANRQRLIAALRSMKAQPRRPAVQRNREIEDTTIPALAEVGQWLKDFPGRKNLMWVAGSFDAAPTAESPDMLLPPKFKGWQEVDPFSRVQMLHLATGRLRLARVALYPIDITGDNKKVIVRRECIQTQTREDTTSIYVDMCESIGPSIDDMAEDTGGQAFHTRDIQTAMLKATEDAFAYYVLSYSPRKLKYDGKVRTIKIGTTRKDAHLRYRRKYFADDPANVLKSDNVSSVDVVLNRPTGTVPWTIVRVTKGMDSSTASDPLIEVMRYGAPASRDIVFGVHVTAKERPTIASRQQMEELQAFESFFSDRIRAAVPAGKSTKVDSLRVETLPSPVPEVVQPFSIEYSIPLNQLQLKNTNDGTPEAELEIAILAYDEFGKRVAGLKHTVRLSIHPFRSAQSPDPEYLHVQTIDFPARTAFVRLAVRDTNANKTGSLEIPMWAINNPYQRKRLEFPADLD